MALEKTWRWFGWNDPITPADIRQMGVEGLVTSLHHITAGDVRGDAMRTRFLKARRVQRWSDSRYVDNAQLSSENITTAADQGVLVTAERQFSLNF
jgi:D-mannonate dehydratase